MISEVTLTPTDSLLLVMDGPNGEIPESMDGRLVMATPTCIVVGTRSSVDGQVSVVLTDERKQVVTDPGLKKAFTGVLVTPEHKVNLYTVDLKSVAKLPVSRIQNRVEVWADSTTEPTKVLILVGETRIGSVR